MVRTKGPRSSDGQTLRSREMAGRTIDTLTDTAASPDERAKRKTSLLKGPLEFRTARVDQARAKK